MLKKIAKSALNLFWPLYCEICKCRLHFEYNLNICEVCISKISYNKAPFCKICGRSLFPEKKFSDYCRDCRKNDFKFERIYSACIYDGIAKEALHAFKYNRNMHIGKTLSMILMKFFEENINSKRFDFIVPIPLFAAKEREREFNQSFILAEPISKKFSIPISRNNLVKIKPTPSQTMLTKEERLVNQAGAFMVKDPSKFYKKILLVVDDAFTTGSTMNEAALTLKNAGSQGVFGLTLIRG